MARRRAPYRTAAQAVQDWQEWAQQMYEWGRRVRADIVRLERACAKCSKVSFSKKAKLVSGQPKWKGDPGDPPTPPT